MKNIMRTFAVAVVIMGLSSAASAVVVRGYDHAGAVHHGVVHTDAIAHPGVAHPVVDHPVVAHPVATEAATQDAASVHIREKAAVAAELAK